PAVLPVDLLLQAGDEFAERAPHAERVAKRRALGDADAEPAVEPAAPQVVLAEDVADLPGRHLAGGQAGKEITLGEPVADIGFETRRHGPAIERLHFVSFAALAISLSGLISLPGALSGHLAERQGMPTGPILHIRDVSARRKA